MRTPGIGSFKSRTTLVGSAAQCQCRCQCPGRLRGFPDGRGRGLSLASGHGTDDGGRAGDVRRAGGARAPRDAAARARHGAGAGPGPSGRPQRGGLAHHEGPPPHGPALGRAARPARAGPRQRRRGRGRGRGRRGDALAGRRRGVRRARDRPAAGSPSTPWSTRRCWSPSRRRCRSRRRPRCRWPAAPPWSVCARRPGWPTASGCWSTVRPAESAPSPSSSATRWGRRSPRCAGPATSTWSARWAPSTSSTTRARTSPPPAAPTTWCSTWSATARLRDLRRLVAPGGVLVLSGGGTSTGKRQVLGPAWLMLRGKVAAPFLKLKVSVPQVAAGRRPARRPGRAGRGRDHHAGRGPDLPAGRGGSGDDLPRDRARPGQGGAHGPVGPRSTTVDRRRRRW